MSSLTAWMSKSTGPGATILIRLVVAIVFLSAGVQKFLYPQSHSVGMMQSAGISYPRVVGPVVATVEVVCAALVLLGLWTRAAALPLVIVIATAIITTKYELFFDSTGFWNAIEMSSLDLSMLAMTLFLLIHGAGPWSVDGGG